MRFIAILFSEMYHTLVCLPIHPRAFLDIFSIFPYKSQWFSSSSCGSIFFFCERFRLQKKVSCGVNPISFSQTKLRFYSASRNDVSGYDGEASSPHSVFPFALGRHHLLYITYMKLYIPVYSLSLQS